MPVNFLQVRTKELSIRGPIEYSARFADVVDLLSRRDLSGLITHRFTLDRLEDATDLLAGSRVCGKVMVTVH